MHLTLRDNLQELMMSFYAKRTGFEILCQGRKTSQICKNRTQFRWHIQRMALFKRMAAGSTAALTKVKRVNVSMHGDFYSNTRRYQRLRHTLGSGTTPHRGAVQHRCFTYLTPSGKARPARVRQGYWSQWRSHHDTWTRSGPCWSPSGNSHRWIRACNHTEGELLQRKQ